MPWITTPEVARFLARAESFLVADVVSNNALLTEARFWAALPDAPAGSVCGWWEGEDGGVEAAFVHLPDHPVLCSRLGGRAATALPEVVPSPAGIGIDADDVAAVSDAWAARGRSLSAAAQLTLLRLRMPTRAGHEPEGHARPADEGDLPILRAWFRLFRERHPDDASHEAFVIDQPFADRGILIWELGGQPVAMASRTPRIAGMVRMGLAFQPTPGTAYAQAAFTAACREAAGAAETVLVLAGSDEHVAAHRAVGFEPVLQRVVLRER